MLAQRVTTTLKTLAVLPAILLLLPLMQGCSSHSHYSSHTTGAWTTGGSYQSTSASSGQGLGLIQEDVIIVGPGYHGVVDAPMPGYQDRSRSSSRLGQHYQWHRPQGKKDWRGLNSSPGTGLGE